MQCSFLLNQVRLTINDPDSHVWSDGDLINALNEALFALVSYRPDASSVTQTITLVAGTKQTLPSGGMRFLSAIRNRGVNGASDAGRAIKKGDMRAQDAIYPDWHEAPWSGYITQYFFDPLQPKVFYVYPPAPVSPAWGIDISFVGEPAVIEDATDTLPVDSFFVPALQEWMLYSLWRGDDEQSPNYASAKGHLDTFFKLLQVKSAADGSAMPKAVSGQ